MKKSVFNFFQNIDGNDYQHGIGLGLILCKHLINRLGPQQEIKIKSSEGKGSSISFSKNLKHIHLNQHILVLFNHANKIMLNSKAQTSNLPGISSSSLSPIFLTSSLPKVFNFNESEIIKDHNIDIYSASPLRLASIRSYSISHPENANRNENSNSREFFKRKCSKSFFHHMNDDKLDLEEKKEQIDVRKMEFDIKNDLEAKQNDLSSYESVENVPSRFN